MSVLRVAPIVEGQGEVEACRVLLQRIATDLLSDCWIDCEKPVRLPRNQLTDPQKLHRSIRFATERLAGPGLVLLLMDSDKECPARLAPTLHRLAGTLPPGTRISVVLAHVEYETWFAAAGDSLRPLSRSSIESPVPADPEGQGVGKRWIERLMGGSYSETVDQVRLTAAMDLAACKSRSPSFDKLVRDLVAAFGSV